MQSLLASPLAAKPTPSELAASGELSDLLPLVDPSACDCGECNLCDDQAAAELAATLGLVADEPTEYDAADLDAEHLRTIARETAISDARLGRPRKAPRDFDARQQQTYLNAFDATALELLLDAAERSGFEGDDMPPVPRWLGRKRTELVKLAYLSGMGDRREINAAIEDRYERTVELGW